MTNARVHVINPQHSSVGNSEMNTASLAVEQEILVRLEKQAGFLKTTAAKLAHEALLDYLADLEGAEEALHRLSTPQEPISITEMKARLNL